MKTFEDKLILLKTRTFCYEHLKQMLGLWIKFGIDKTRNDEYIYFSKKLLMLKKSINKSITQLRQCARFSFVENRWVEDGKK